MRINRDSIHPSRHLDELGLLQRLVEIRVVVGEDREISELLRSREIEPSTSTFETIMDGDDLAEDNCQHDIFEGLEKEASQTYRSRSVTSLSTNHSISFGVAAKRCRESKFGHLERKGVVSLRSERYKLTNS